ncbi:MAG TPA: hypothetical protein VFX89_17230 [Gammaproteobacteria bacterium]|nr:hypothetical protein [Gammaproteobacteria bacterium]
MKTRAIWTTAASAVALCVHLATFTSLAEAQDKPRPWTQRTPWGDPNLQGQWTTEHEYGVPFERPTQFGTRELLTDEEYAKRLADVEERDARDLKPVDVLAGKVEGAGAPIPHWREYETDSRRTSLVIDPKDGRLPPRTPQAAPLRVERCGSLARGEPCDSYKDYNLGVRCIVHGGGFPDAMFPAVYNANFQIVQAPGVVAITYELIHDTRVIPIDPSPKAEAKHLSPAIRMYMGDARGHWEGNTLVVETTNLKAATRGASPELRLIERFTRVSSGLIQYQVTFVDPATWTAPWTAALDMKARPDDAGVFEYACHEGNLGLHNMLSTARYLERTAGQAGTPSKESR